ncbi:MAG TPA: hypothetical protein VGM86_02140 [Thermoanaerobaculia bacterium]
MSSDFPEILEHLWRPLPRIRGLPAVAPDEKVQTSDRKKGTEEDRADLAGAVCTFTLHDVARQPVEEKEATPEDSDQAEKPIFHRRASVL